MKPKKRTRSRIAATAQASCPVVGIGASAGGLEALEGFLAHVPNNSGMAFVIVQHLDPTRKGIMPELLQRSTGMTVVQVKDGTVVRPDRVYVIPPNKDMSILHGSLHLLEPTSPRGLRLPIDFFLRSLAHDQKERSMGVILSGMGSDGTLGLRAIKETAGLVLVQDPRTAKFDAMPRSAISAGLADIVGAVEALPGKIMDYVKRSSRIHKPEHRPGDKTQSALAKAVILLRAHTGHDFSMYKQNTFQRRIERRMGIHQIDRIADYVRYLRENTQELDLLFKELLIGVTSFFRDGGVWDELNKRILPALLAAKTNGQTLRIWVPGCSTGEEAYSMAMAFKEVMDKVKPRKKLTLQIFATDLDKDAINKARQGLYPENIASDVSPRRLARFFVKEGQGCRVSTEIREMVVFAQQSVIMDPPFTKLDLLSCRNLMIYLTPELQKKLIPLFHYSLNPGGVLLLGSAESVGTFTDLFRPLNNKFRIFRRIESALRVDPIEFPSAFAPHPMVGDGSTTMPRQVLSLQSQADQLVLEHYASPTVLVNDKGNVLYVSGRTGRYLEPAAGKANWNIFAMAREGLRYELSNAFYKSLDQKHPVVVRGLGLEGRRVEMSVQRLMEPEGLRGMVMIVFVDIATPPAERASGHPVHKGKSASRNSSLHELERKYQQARLESQSIREEIQTSQEELRSTNEEQQSTNEELQSTNEELTTSKEEMQSLNEELQTVNSELQVKVDELSRANNDMKNLLNSTDIATLFLDTKLKVRRFTTQATKLIKLIPGDVGRPITDLASDLIYPKLPADARVVLRRLGFMEKTVTARDGRWFTVRIMPYRTLDDRVDGVVITFADITVAKTLEAQLRATQAGLEKRVAAQPGHNDRHRRPDRRKRVAARDTTSHE